MIFLIIYETLLSQMFPLGLIQLTSGEDSSIPQTTAEPRTGVLHQLQWVLQSSIASCGELADNFLSPPMILVNYSLWEWNTCDNNFLYMESIWLNIRNIYKSLCNVISKYYYSVNCFTIQRWRMSFNCFAFNQVDFFIS